MFLYYLSVQISAFYTEHINNNMIFYNTTEIYFNTSSCFNNTRLKTFILDGKVVAQGLGLNLKLDHF